MQMTPASQRQRAQALRRDQLRRRRAIASVVVVILVALAVWAAYAIPGRAPAVVPENAAAPVLAETPVVTEDVVIARAEGIEILLPVARDVTTAVAFHSVDNSDAISLEPSGERASGGTLGQRLADVFAGGGGLQYYLTAETGGGSSSTAGLDIGAVPGSPVVSPVDGKVVAMKQYKILGRYNDIELHIQLSRDPSLLLVVTHLAHPQVAVGEVVARGETVLGDVRGFSAGLDQALSQYTSDNGDHVHFMVLRITPELADL
ncbi:MAG TPA: M23 family metallopeptidase [Thermoleophilia bacterium]|nr:M23 family metallopeptidase [Thermoleophilia bacterium]